MDTISHQINHSEIGVMFTNLANYEEPPCRTLDGVFSGENLVFPPKISPRKIWEFHLLKSWIFPTSEIESGNSEKWSSEVSAAEP